MALGAVPVEPPLSLTRWHHRLNESQLLLHSSGSYRAEAGISLIELRQWLRHTSVDTTQIYINLTDRQAKRVMKATSLCCEGALLSGTPSSSCRASTMDAHLKVKFDSFQLLCLNVPKNADRVECGRKSCVCHCLEDDFLDFFDSHPEPKCRSHMGGQLTLSTKYR